MDTQEILKKVRKIEIKTRGLSQNIFADNTTPLLRGGMAFSEVREYQFGDDVRDIDWNVTARFHHPYVKVFEEERELTVMLLIDVSRIARLRHKATAQARPRHGDCCHTRLQCHPEQR